MGFLLLYTTYDTHIRDYALRADLFAYQRNLRVKKNKIISSFACIPLNVIFIVTIMFRARGFLEYYVHSIFIPETSRQRQCKYLLVCLFFYYFIPEYR